jgi:hypothetical protein
VCLGVATRRSGSAVRRGRLSARRVGTLRNEYCSWVVCGAASVKGVEDGVFVLAVLEGSTDSEIIENSAGLADWFVDSMLLKYGICQKLLASLLCY